MANPRAILLMITAMAFFAVCDACIKLASQSLEIGQILLTSSVGSMLLFLPVLLREPSSMALRNVVDRAVLIRTGGEVFGSLGFVVSLSLIPLSTASSIMQAQPLAVTFAAALFLRERVGWRRWSAVALGFVGVIVILRPGTGGFDPNALWMILTVAGLTARDIGTRMLPRHVTTAFVSALAMAGLAVLGFFVMLWQDGWQPVPGLTWVWIACISLTVSAAFVSITAALRLGEVSAIAPFRYTRIIFALVIAFVVFGERPDAATWIGAALIVGSGLYAFWRERRVHSARPEAGE